MRVSSPKEPIAPIATTMKWLGLPWPRKEKAKARKARRAKEKAERRRMEHPHTKQHQVSLEIAISAENQDTGQLNVAQEEKAKEERMGKAQKERKQKVEAKQPLPNSHRQRSRNLWIKIGYVLPLGVITAKEVKRANSLMHRSY